MGLYDEIVCGVQLPDQPTVVDTSFQTKSLPWPCLERYCITTAGRLVDRNDRDLEPIGYIKFYRHDPDSANGIIEYRARFVDGTLQSIVNIGEPDDRIYGLESIRWFALHADAKGTAATNNHAAELNEEIVDALPFQDQGIGKNPAMKSRSKQGSKRRYVTARDVLADLPPPAIGRRLKVNPKVSHAKQAVKLMDAEASAAPATDGSSQRKPWEELRALGGRTSITASESGAGGDPPTDAANALSRELRSFLDDWESKHGKFTPEELTLAASELTVRRGQA